MINRQVVDEIISRTDIENLISGYISLTRAGSNLKGLCPFHSEKTPSFTVYPAENSFYCFGCGIGGNAITFIRQAEHLDYPDAVEFLAKRAGITVIRDEDKSDPYRSVNKKRIYDMNVEAAKFFHGQLFCDNEGAKRALSYFVDKRALSSATIKHFGLGYAPDSFDALIKFMTSKGYSKDELVTANLARKSERGYYTDAFRNRVMFPVIDVSGNLIAFGGRVLDDSKPKYLNTTDTPVFKKSRNLFALNFAKGACSESLILCEGYMDVIALHAAGFTNAVATLGTAITPEQARIMNRYTKKVFVSYDADEAGQKAADKALKLLSEVGLDVGVIKLPDAKDPDEYIKKHGREKFVDVLNQSKSRFEYKMDAILTRFDINLPQDKIKALGELENLISMVYSKAERDIYIQTVAKLFSVSPSSIKEDVEKIDRKKAYIDRKNQQQTIRQRSIGYEDKVNRDFVKMPLVAKNEENVLGLLLLFPEHRKLVFTDGLLTDGDFCTDFNKRVFSFISRASSSSEVSIDDLDEEFTPEEVGRITKIKLNRMALGDNGKAVLLEAVDSLKKSVNKTKSSEVTSIDDLSRMLDLMRKK